MPFCDAHDFYQACSALLEVLPSYWERATPRKVFTAPHLTGSLFTFLDQRVELFGKVDTKEVAYDSPWVPLHSPAYHFLAFNEIPLRMNLTLPQRKRLLEQNAEAVLVHLEGYYQREGDYRDANNRYLKDVELFFVADMRAALLAVELTKQINNAHKASSETEQDSSSEEA